MPYYLAGRHVGPADAACGLPSCRFAIAITGPIVGRHIGRLGDRRLTAGGLITAGLGLLEIVLWHHEIGLMIGLALTGLGIGAFTPANNATIMASALPRRTGLVSGMLNMSRGLGTALGVAVAGMLYTAEAGVSGASAAQANPAAAARGLVLSLSGLGLTHSWSALPS